MNFADKYLLMTFLLFFKFRGINVEPYTIMLKTSFI